MAPRDQPKTPPKVQRSSNKTNISKTKKSSQISAAVSVSKRSMSTAMNKTPVKVIKPTAVEFQKSTTVPTTPKSKETNPAMAPASVSKSGKKLWKRRPKPAHSGVPVPEKMRKLIAKRLAQVAD